MDNFIDPALGCKPLTAPDLGNPGAQSSSLALNELLAGAQTGGPVALVPPNDPMTLNNAKASLTKTNLYRAGVNQPQIQALGNEGAMYCQNLMQVGPAALARDAALFTAAPSPDPGKGANLLAFLTQRLQASVVDLGCAALLANGANAANAANAANGANAAKGAKGK